MAEHRTSQQRNLIYSIVKDSCDHPSADDVYVKARQHIANISLGTVYRNLRLLAQEGRIREVSFESGPSRYDGMIEAHEHFICTTCGKVFDIQPTISLPNLAGKKVSNYRLDYYGRCEGCLG